MEYTGDFETDVINCMLEKIAANPVVYGAGIGAGLGALSDEGEYIVPKALAGAGTGALLGGLAVELGRRAAKANLSRTFTKTLPESLGTAARRMVRAYKGPKGLWARWKPLIGLALTAEQYISSGRAANLARILRAMVQKVRTGA